MAFYGQRVHRAIILNARIGPINDHSMSDNNGSAPTTDDSKRPECGIVMPISDCDGYPSSHWLDVLTILKSAITEAGFEPRPVWAKDDTNIVQRNIVNGLYHLPMVVCDISSNNPNVMFELGLRLAFDLPVVVVKDDDTKAPFDVAVIEYLPYPKSLRHAAIETFKSSVGAKIKATADAAKEQGYSQFLKHFTDLKPKHLGTEEVPILEFVERRFDQLTEQIQSISIARKTSNNVVVSTHVASSRHSSTPTWQQDRELDDIASYRLIDNAASVPPGVLDSSLFERVHSSLVTDFGRDRVETWGGVDRVRDLYFRFRTSEGDKLRRARGE